MIIEGGECSAADHGGKVENADADLPDRNSGTGTMGGPSNSGDFDYGRWFLFWTDRARI